MRCNAGIDKLRNDGAQLGLLLLSSTTCNLGSLVVN